LNAATFARAVPLRQDLGVAFASQGKASAFAMALLARRRRCAHRLVGQRGLLRGTPRLRLL
jgi:hypothetical protein